MFPDLHMPSEQYRAVSRVAACLPSSSVIHVSAVTPGVENACVNLGTLAVTAIDLVQFTPMGLNAVTFAHVRTLPTVTRSLEHVSAVQAG